MDHSARLAAVQAESGLTDEQVAQFKSMESIDFELADRLVENVIGTMSIPIGVATNMIVDGTERTLVGVDSTHFYASFFSSFFPNRTLRKTSSTAASAA